MSIWIKICGITRAVDANIAVAAGANALGVVFYARSRRAMDLERLPQVMADVPGTVKRVALFVDPDRALVETVCDSAYIDWLQFQGSESSQFCESFGKPYVKALHVGGEEKVTDRLVHYESAEAILLDTYDKSAPGGTGKTFDWSLVRELPEQVREKLILAGGLTADNVAQAINTVAPFGVDVSSGVEIEPGIKDADKLKAFIEGARNG